jgi:hypothetical protein
VDRPSNVNHLLRELGRPLPRFPPERNPARPTPSVAGAPELSRLTIPAGQNTQTKRRREWR